MVRVSPLCISEEEVKPILYSIIEYEVKARIQSYKNKQTKKQEQLQQNASFLVNTPEKNLDNSSHGPGNLLLIVFVVVA